ncbi:MAG: DUF6913 domain-containing protein [Bacteroidia bacterium]
MQIIEWIKNFFAHRKFKDLMLRGKRFSRDFIGLNRAKSIGIIFNANQCNIEDIKELRAYVEQMKAKGKHVVLIELNYLKQSIPQFQHTVQTVFINPEKYNWFGCPKQQVETQLSHHKLDILLNCDTSQEITSHYVCAILEAKMRTGMYVQGMEPYYDLMLDGAKEQRISKKIQHFEHYLKMIDKT